MLGLVACGDDDDTSSRPGTSTSTSMTNSTSTSDDDGVIKLATCTDGVQNGTEVGVDCGGSRCKACEAVATCSDGVKNGTEEAVDCGGDCKACNVAPGCADGIQNGTEEGVDCGGDCKACEAVATCSDGVKNGTEEEVDCGGDCKACTVAPGCADGVKNGTEVGVDCGGDCKACEAAPTCSDGVKNGNEEGVDCGGSCAACKPKGCTPIAGAKRMFVTSRAYKPGRGSSAASFGSEICSLHAEAAGLTGEWSGWLSQFGRSAKGAFPDVPYYLLDQCTQVSRNMAALLISGPTKALTDESGNALVQPFFVWTGTTKLGSPSLEDCQGWIRDSSSFMGTVGKAYVLGAGKKEEWTEAKVVTCDEEHHVLCMER